MRRSAPRFLLLFMIAASLGYGCASRTSETSSASTASRLYVSDETGGNVDVVDPTSGHLIAKIAVGKRPVALLQRIAVGGSPWGVALAEPE